MSRSLIVDAPSLYCRTYREGHGVHTRMANSIRKAVALCRVDSVLIAWDGANAKEYRRRICPEYKVGRKPKPPGFYERMHESFQFLQQSWLSEVYEDYEADDIIAAAVNRGLASDGSAKYFVFSDDQDMYQLLLADQVTQLRRLYPRPMFMTAQALERDEEIPPGRWLDYRILVGDKSDNLKGVPGIGPDNAKKIITAYPTLDEAVKNYDRIPISKKMRTLLTRAASQGVLDDMREAMSFRDDCPLKFRRKQTPTEILDGIL